VEVELIEGAMLLEASSNDIYHCYMNVNDKLNLMHVLYNLPSLIYSYALFMHLLYLLYHYQLFDRLMHLLYIYSKWVISEILTVQYKWLGSSKAKLLEISIEPVTERLEEKRRFRPRDI
jgi:hypothetical protein